MLFLFNFPFRNLKKLCHRGQSNPTKDANKCINISTCFSRMARHILKIGSELANVTVRTKMSKKKIPPRGCPLASFTIIQI